ncbi:hypothetical protein N2152v2_009309 [Parachlorella kessleri]
MIDSISFLLRALGYPKVAGFAHGDPAQFRALLVWLENTKIRQYPIDGRKQLQAEDPAAWQTAFAKYLADLECPVPADRKLAVLRWLLSHAMGLEYQDRAEQLTAAAEQAQAGAPSPDAWVESEPQPLEDAADDAVQQQIRELLQLLQISVEQDLPTGLQQLRDVLELQILPALTEMARHPLGLQQSAQQQSHAGGVAAELPAAAAALRQYPLGFSTGDATSDLAATILRMLYIKDLRALQTLVDKTIVQVQEFTANPRTDAALGKVGR